MFHKNSNEKEVKYNISHTISHDFGLVVQEFHFLKELE